MTSVSGTSPTYLPGGNLAMGGKVEVVGSIMVRNRVNSGRLEELVTCSDAAPAA
jgi:hypothetical protein